MYTTNNTHNLPGTDDKKSHSTAIVFIAIIAVLLSVILTNIAGFLGEKTQVSMSDNATIYNWKYVSANREAALLDASSFWENASKENPIKKTGDYLRLTSELPPSETELRLYITTANNKLSVTADGTVLIDTLSGSSPFSGSSETILTIPASNNETHLDVILYSPLALDFSASVYSVGKIPSATLFYTYFDIIIIGLTFAFALCLLLIWFGTKSANNSRYYLILLSLINLFAGISLLLNRSGIKILSFNSPIAYHLSLFFIMQASILTLLLLINKTRISAVIKLFLIALFSVSVLVLINLTGIFTLFLIQSFGVLLALCILSCIVNMLKNGASEFSKFSFAILMTVLFLQCAYWLSNLLNTKLGSHYMYYYSILVLSAVFTVTYIKVAMRPPSDDTELVSFAGKTEFLFDLKDQTLLQKTIGTLLASKSDTENHHILHVAEYVKIMCLHMKKTEQEADFIAKAALLHDIGKIVVPTRVMFKQEQLTKEEFEQIQSHVFYGYNILSGNDDELLTLAADIAKQHHEYFDGTGYLGIKGKTIHPYARLTAVADVFDALTNARSYKKAWSFEEAFNYILIHSGDYFDPEMVNVFNESRYEIETAYKRFRGVQG